MESFGYMPHRGKCCNLLNRIIGIPNLIKRIQASTIMQMLDLNQKDVFLDFGCGHGAFAKEASRRCKLSFGIDTVTKPIPPEELKHKLYYFNARGTRLPFKNEVFDKILMSEVIPMIDNPVLFIKEAKRVLKPGGRIICVNGIGHPAIQKLYESKNSIFMKIVERLNLPKSYEQFTHFLTEGFGTAVRGFFNEETLIRLFTDEGFVVEETAYSMREMASKFLSYFMFTNYAMGLETTGYNQIVFYPFLNLLEKIDRRTKGMGFLFVVKKITYENEEEMQMSKEISKFN